MTSKSKVETHLIQPEMELSPTQMDSSLSMPMDIETGPQGYWIRSQSGLKRMGYQINTTASNSGLAQWTEKDWNAYDIFQVTLGVQGTTGHVLKLLGAEQVGETLRILVAHMKPKGPVGEALTYPMGMFFTRKWPEKQVMELWIDGKKSNCQWHIVD